MNTPLQCDVTPEEHAKNNGKVAAFAEAVGYIETDLYDVFSRLKLAKESDLTAEQKAKLNRAEQRFAKCLQEYGLQPIPTDQ